MIRAFIPDTESRGDIEPYIKREVQWRKHETRIIVKLILS